MQGFLVLEDGTVFRGRGFTIPGVSVGEVVFNTSMTGYQEILTDPSYCEQIVTMTYPLIGNYGINDEDVESSRVQVAGFVVYEACRTPSNWRKQKTLIDYLTEYGVIGLEGVDTRALTRRIRLEGAMRGAIAVGDYDVDEVLKQVQDYPGMVGRNLAERVSCPKPYWWSKEGEYKVVVVDYGVKYNILRMLEARGCKLYVVPAKSDAEEILAEEPDGIFLSNGPGDPAAVLHAIRTIRKLLGEKPIFGICLGHQLLALALGAHTYKLKFGHRGANQPVKYFKTGRVEITAQNHGFAVNADTVPEGVEITHINLNDDTVEGIECCDVPAFSVQYHPEASPGPHDASYLFDKFIDLMKKCRR